MDTDSEKLKAQLDAALQQLKQANAEKAELQRRLAPTYGREPAPNWVAWKAVPGVALWEAVALSLGVEPSDRVLQTIQAGPQQTRRFQRSDAPPEIFERLQHCKRALSVSGPIVPQSLYAGARSDYKCPVLLSEVVTFLQGAGFAIPQELDGLTAPNVASAPTPEVERLNSESPRIERVEPIPRSKAQDAAILSAIKAAGYEPKRLPKNAPGLPGVKAEIRSRVSTERPDLFPTEGTTFHKAWERLRSFGDVADKED